MKKQIKFELWDIKRECGFQVNDVLDGIDQAIEQYSNWGEDLETSYYLILKDGKLVRTVSVDKYHKVNWVIHSK